MPQPDPITEELMNMLVKMHEEGKTHHTKRRHPGRQSVLLTKEATIVLREAAKREDRSFNKTASKIIIAHDK